SRIGLHWEHDDRLLTWRCESDWLRSRVFTLNRGPGLFRMLGRLILLKDRQTERDARNRPHDLRDDSPDERNPRRTHLVLLFFRFLKLRRGGRCRRNYTRDRFCDIAGVHHMAPSCACSPSTTSELLKLNETGVAKGWQSGEKRVPVGKDGYGSPTI